MSDWQGKLVGGVVILVVLYVGLQVLLLLSGSITLEQFFTPSWVGFATAHPLAFAAIIALFSLAGLGRIAAFILENT